MSATVAFAVCGALLLASSHAAAVTTQDSITRSGAINNMKSSKMCIDDKNGGTTNGSQIRLWPCNKQIAQKITAELGDKGFVNLKVMDGCLDVNGALKTAGTKVQYYECNGNSAQQWLILSNGSILNPNSGKCLGTRNNTVVQGAQLGIYNCNKDTAQRWRLPKGVATVQANAPISFKSDKTLCFDSMSELQQIQTAECNNGKQQKWLVMRVNNAAAYKFMVGNRCLGVNDTDVTNRKVVNRACSNATEQLWTLGSSSNKNIPKDTLVHNDSGKCLDTESRTAELNQPLVLHECGTTKNNIEGQRLIVPKK